MALSDSGVRTVLVTTPDAEVGAEIARDLVASRLAACVNVIPGIRSVFRWEGAVQEETEAMLIIKTAAHRCGELAARIHDLHPYDLPEVIELAATGGSDSYLAWIGAETRP